MNAWCMRLKRGEARRDRASVRDGFFLFVVFAADGFAGFFAGSFFTGDDAEDEDGALLAEPEVCDARSRAQTNALTSSAR